MTTHKTFIRPSGSRRSRIYKKLMLSSAVAVVFCGATNRSLGDAAAPIMLEELEFREAKVQDAIRGLAEITGVNLVATSEAGKKTVTVFLRNQSVPDMVDSICRVSGLWYRFNPDTGTYVIMTTEEYQEDIVVFRDETTQMFQLKYLNVGMAARTIYDLYGERVQWAGQVNQHLGNDYEVGNTFADFEENYDRGDEDGSSDGAVGASRSGQRSRRSGRSSNSHGGSNYLDQEPLRNKDFNLSPERISQLETLTGQTSSRVEEGQLSQVTRNRAPPIYITVNRLHNLLFVRTADENALEQIAEIVENSDRQVPEVLLEMKVLAVSLNDQFDSAFDISFIDDGTRRKGPDDGMNSNPLNAAAAAVGSPLLGLGQGALIENSALVFQSLSDDLRIRIQFLAQDNHLKTLATPMLMAANNQPASLFIGEETVLTVGYKNQEVTVSGDATVVVNTPPVPETIIRRVGNKLTILPSINADRSVVMRLVHENSTVKKGGGNITLINALGVAQKVPIDTVDTSTLEGTVLAHDGKTIAVGGMMRTTLVDNEQKVPFLGDIPLLGMLFKSKQTKEVKTELVLLITPHVLSAPAAGEALTRRRLAELMSNPDDLNLHQKIKRPPPVDPELNEEEISL